MKNLSVLLLMALVLKPAFSQTMYEDLKIPSQVNEYANSGFINIDSDCEGDYPSDNRMRSYCIERENEAKNEVTSRLLASPTEVLNHCYKNSTWTARKYCIIREKNSKDKVFRLAISIPSDERRRCMKNWSTWSMVEYCMERVKFNYSDPR